MATAQDMINEALKLIAVYAPGETPTDADIEQGLTCLNDMLDSWSNESLATYAVLEQTEAKLQIEGTSFNLLNVYGVHFSNPILLYIYIF